MRVMLRMLHVAYIFVSKQASSMHTSSMYTDKVAVNKSLHAITCRVSVHSQTGDEVLKRFCNPVILYQLR